MIRKKLFENFAHPRGLWGRLAGQLMAHKPANVERGRWALAELDAGPDDHVLELGYGPGVTLSGGHGDWPPGLTGAHRDRLRARRAHLGRVSSSR